MQKLYRIRYHFTKERFGVLESTKEQDAKMVEWDKFDDNSVHLVTEHGGKILATIRFIMDSKDLGLPADTQQNLDYLRKNGKVVWEPEGGYHFHLLQEGLAGKCCALVMSMQKNRG